MDKTRCGFSTEVETSQCFQSSPGAWPSHVSSGSQVGNLFQRIQNMQIFVPLEVTNKK